MVKPVGAVSPAATRLLLVMLTRPAEERWTIRAVADATRLSPTYAHLLLVQLRDAGCVTWTDGNRATLRVTVAPVALPAFVAA